MLRTIAETGSYYRDGSVETLEEAVKTMGEYQLRVTISDEDTADIVAFKKATMSGEVPLDYIALPTLPESRLDTPAPVTQ